MIFFLIFFLIFASIAAKIIDVHTPLGGFSNQVFYFDLVMNSLSPIQELIDFATIRFPGNQHARLVFDDECDYRNFFWIRSVEDCAEKSFNLTNSLFKCQKYFDFLKKTSILQNIRHLNSIKANLNPKDVCNEAGKSIEPVRALRLNAENLSKKTSSAIDIVGGSTLFFQNHSVSFFEAFDFSPEIKSLADKISKKLFKRSVPDVTIHARLGDFKDFCARRGENCFFEEKYYIELINRMQKEFDGADIFVMSQKMIQGHNAIAISEDWEKFLIESTENKCIKKHAKFTKQLVEFIIASRSKRIYLNRFSSFSKLLSVFRSIQLGGIDTELVLLHKNLVKDIKFKESKLNWVDYCRRDSEYLDQKQEYQV